MSVEVKENIAKITTPAGSTYYTRNKPKIKLQQKVYYQKHRKKLNETAKSYYKDNKDEILKKNKTSDRKKEYDRRYYLKNSNKINARKKDVALQKKVRGN